MTRADFIRNIVAEVVGVMTHDRIVKRCKGAGFEAPTRQAIESALAKRRPCPSNIHMPEKLAELRRLHAATDKPRTDGHTFGPNDCRFYCAVHAAVPFLLDEIERLRRQVEDLNDELREQGERNEW